MLLENYDCLSFQCVGVFERYSDIIFLQWICNWFEIVEKNVEHISGTRQQTL